MVVTFNALLALHLGSGSDHTWLSHAWCNTPGLIRGALQPKCTLCKLPSRYHRRVRLAQPWTQAGMPNPACGAKPTSAVVGALPTMTVSSYIEILEISSSNLVTRSAAAPSKWSRLIAASEMTANPLWWDQFNSRSVHSQIQQSRCPHYVL